MDELPVRVFVDPFRPVKKKVKGIRKRSRARAKQEDEYRELRRDFLQEHPYCQWFMQEHGISEDVAIANCGIVLAKIKDWITGEDKIDYVTVPHSTEIHHKRGRIGNLLIDIRFFLAVSSEGHRAIHHFTKISYEKGYMLPR